MTKVKKESLSKGKKDSPVSIDEQGKVKIEEDLAIPNELPVLPSRDFVPFPSVMMSLYVGRTLSVKAVEAAVSKDKFIFVTSQKTIEVEEPSGDDLCQVGVIATVVRNLKLPEGGYKVLMQGLARAKVTKYIGKGSYLKAKIEPLVDQKPAAQDGEDERIIKTIRDTFQILVEHEQIPEEMLLVIEAIEDPGILADVILAHYRLDNENAQAMLENLNPRERLLETEKVVTDDLNQFIISEEIKDQASTELAKGQREYYLREQIKQIKSELGELEESYEDLFELRKNLEKAKLPAQAQREVDKQLSRIDRMHQESSEYAITRTYLEWIADLPWNSRTRDRLDLGKTREILDEDHFGLDKPKERILEFLSVRKLKKDSKGPILCFVGPPGVGKTSLGRSISRALNRQFFRISVGGVRDEAEIRGHRRTYVGALPGRIIQGLKQAKSNNPVFVLDELDKIGADFRGDPASALLEVLDSEQNKDFTDHYLGIGFDLSSVLFVATANTIDTIPGALLDRLEIINIPGYTTQEKEQIGLKFLVPQQIQENGLGKFDIKVSKEAVSFIIERYTRESGVRNLAREIGSLLRKITRIYVEEKRLISEVDEGVVRELLGVTKFDPELDEREDLVGMVRGLAWTVHGGEVLPVEVSTAKGKGVLSLTGQLGDVMQESAKAAMFYARSHAEKLGIDPDFHEKLDIHIHLPGGAIPKDGPSAGITIATALVSALSGRKVSKDVSMTGEITLRGKVMAIGGLKEKALAALRHDIKKIVIPFENIKDLDDIAKEQRERLEFIPVKHVDEVLKIALLND